MQHLQIGSSPSSTLCDVELFDIWPNICLTLDLNTLQDCCFGTTYQNQILFLINNNLKTGYSCYRRQICPKVDSWSRLNPSPPLVLHPQSSIHFCRGNFWLTSVYANQSQALPLQKSHYSLLPLLASQHHRLLQMPKYRSRRMQSSFPILPQLNTRQVESVTWKEKKKFKNPKIGDILKY